MFFATQVFGWGITMPDYRWEEDEAALAPLVEGLGGLFDAAAQLASLDMASAASAEVAPAPEPKPEPAAPPAPATSPASDKTGRWVQAGWRQVRYNSYLYDALADAMQRQTLHADAGDHHFTPAPLRPRGDKGQP